MKTALLIPAPSIDLLLQRGVFNVMSGSVQSAHQNLCSQTWPHKGSTAALMPGIDEMRAACHDLKRHASAIEFSTKGARAPKFKPHVTVVRKTKCEVPALIVSNTKDSAGDTLDSWCPKNVQI